MCSGGCGTAEAVLRAEDFGDVDTLGKQSVYQMGVSNDRGLVGNHSDVAHEGERYGRTKTLALNVVIIDY